jgi:hypothetical protein
MDRVEHAVVVGEDQAVRRDERRAAAADLDRGGEQSAALAVPELLSRELEPPPRELLQGQVLDLLRQPLALVGHGRGQRGETEGGERQTTHGVRVAKGEQTQRVQPSTFCGPERSGLRTPPARKK